MKRLAASFFAILIAATAAPTAEKDSRVFELRVYKVNPGKLPALKDLYNEAVGKYMKKYDIELARGMDPGRRKRRTAVRPARSQGHGLGGQELQGLPRGR